MAASFSFDVKSKRFRNAQGHFISAARGMRSSIARGQYQKYLARKKRPRKKKPLPALKKKKPKVAPIKGRKKKAPPLKKRPIPPKKKRPVPPKKKRPVPPKKKRPVPPKKKRPIPPKKKRPVPPKKKRPIPPKKKRPRKRRIYYCIREVEGIPGQYMVAGIEKMSYEEQAELILTQIISGYQRFRFWFRVKKDSAYPGGVASTFPLHWTFISRKKAMEEVVAFCRHGHGLIFGKIYQYWFAGRRA